jgi:hypothetical protein
MSIFRIAILLIVDLDMVVVVGNGSLLEIVYNENGRASDQIVDHLHRYPERLLIRPILLIIMDHRRKTYIITFYHMFYEYLSYSIGNYSRSNDRLAWRFYCIIRYEWY